MHRIMVRPLSAGVRLTAIFDSCHSGTALDLPYIYSTQGVLKEPNLAKDAGSNILGMLSSYGQGDLNGMFKKGLGLFTRATKGDDAHAKTLATKSSAADVVMLSGSKDDQTSYVVHNIARLKNCHVTNMFVQSRCYHCRTSHRRHVMGLHYSTEKESPTKLRRSSQ